MFFCKQIENRLSEFDKNFANRVVNIKEFATFLETEIYKIISSRFDEDFEFNVEIQTDKNALIDQFMVKGWYAPQCDEGGDCITVELAVYDKEQQSYYLSRYWWSFLKFEIGQVVDHEIIHANQYSKRNYRCLIPTKYTNPAQEYFGSSDEIQAYAYNAAHDMLRYTRGDKQKAINLLQYDNQNISSKMSSIVVCYRDTFVGRQDKLYQKFLSSVVKYIEVYNEQSE